MGRAVCRPRRFSGLQRRLDDPGDTRCDLVLQVENVFERTVEPIGPEMCAIEGFDQLRGDPHTIAGFAHRALENVTDPQLPTNLLYVDRLALVGETRIAGDHEEPADARQRSDDLLDHAVGEIFLLRVALMFWNGSTAIDGLSGSG